MLTKESKLNHFTKKTKLPAAFINLFTSNFTVLETHRSRVKNFKINNPYLLVCHLEQFQASLLQCSGGFAKFFWIH